jgi:hypothetical protein
MAMSSNISSVNRPTRLWHWFAGSFALVFVAMLVLVKITSMHPSGQFAVRSPLWKYYAVALPRAIGPSKLGPASGAGSPLAKTIAQHLAVSAAGGCVGLGIGWMIGRRKSSTSVEQSADSDAQP